MACRFPNPVPSGTRVPQWALIDITVRCYVFFNGNIFTAPFTGSLRTIGTQTSLLQSVVRTLLSFSHYQCLTPTSCFLDSPELAAGAMLGPSGATVSASGTRSGATSSLFSEPSSSVKPTPSPTSKSSSNTGAIVGGVVGGVAVIGGLAAIAIGLFLRRRSSEAPAPVAPPVVGTYQPPMDEIQQPLTMDDGYTASIPGTIGSSMPGTPLAQMRIYVRVSCPIYAPHFYVCSSHALSFFLTLRIRMIHLRSLGTKEFRRHQPPLKIPYRRSMEQETPWLRCRPHGHRVTTACLLSDFELRRHRSTEKSWVRHA